MSFPVSGLPGLVQPPPQDRFLLDDPDSHYWLANVRRMLLEGRWRIRQTDADNAPFGREMHWSSLPAWWLIIVYSLVFAIHPETLTTNLSWTAYFAAPILECAFLLWVALATERRFGPRAAFIAVCGLAAYRSLTMTFAPAITDHHGWHVVTATGTLLGMLCASFSFLPAPVPGSGLEPMSRGADQAANRRTVRGWLIVSGCFAGAGLALGTPAEVLVLGALGAAAVLMLLITCGMAILAHEKSGMGIPAHGHGLKARDTLFMGKDAHATPVVPYPEGWTWWSGSAAITSLLFYLIEYFPNHFSMQLATNHPCYAIACLSAGLILRNLAGGHWHTRGAWLVSWIAGVLGVLLVPALIMLGPDHWFVLKEGYVARMHREISEFQPYFARFGMLTFPETVVRWGVTFLATGIVLRLFIGGKLKRFEQSLLLGGLLMTGLLAAIALCQVRWLNLAAVSGAVLLLIGMIVLESKRALLTYAVALVSIIALFGANIGGRIALYQSLINSKAAPSNLLQPVADREMANALCQLGSRERPVVISSLGKTPLLHLYGGIRGVGSYYWENSIGLRDWADFFGTTSFELAKDIAQRRGIDWILLSDREDFTKMTLRIRNSKPDDAGSTIAARLKQDPALLPSWIQPLGTATVTLGPKAKATFRVFQIKVDKR